MAEPFTLRPHWAPAEEGAATRSATPRPARREQAPATRIYDTTQLFGSGTEIEIRHADAVYRLKITRQGKLILNK